MNYNEQREAARKFALKWQKKGDEKRDAHNFWIELLSNVIGIENATDYIEFEKSVTIDGHAKYIDGYIPTVRVLIENKSFNKDLYKPELQSDGTMLTPYQQAKRYAEKLIFNEVPRYIVTCNFQQFNIYDMNEKNPEHSVQVVKLINLQDQVGRLDFLRKTKYVNISEEMRISKKAGDIIGEIYDEFMKQYEDPTDLSAQHNINVLCVRLVFCFFAEDAGLFKSHSAFHDYLASYTLENMQGALRELFRILDTPYEKRGKFLEEKLKMFPYVNGGLFSEYVDIPAFTDELRLLILKNASQDFDWSEISPTIFGAMFESTLNPETRSKGGMHYTSVENIHKVIDPLFLDGLKREFKVAKETVDPTWRTRRLKALREKMAALTFLDPACGSGNFLTETYISLRKLENKIRDILTNDTKGQMTLDILTNEDLGIKVSITQFYGIEINDFAVSVARTAMWIAEAQMLAKTKNNANISGEFLPLTTNANIIEGNALEIDWNDIIPATSLNYIMGNPPFNGARRMEKNQKKELEKVCKGWKNVGSLDYVSGWYKLALDYIKGTEVHAALVSTNSITQGEAVGFLWKPLIEQGLHIDFAYRTFIWDSEATIKAHVHCVIVGFSTVKNIGKKELYEGDELRLVDNINPYLYNAPNIIVEARKKPLCAVPDMCFGNMPNDGGFLSDYSRADMNYIIGKYPEASVCFKQFMGATEFINGKERWCLWLKDVPPKIIKSVKPIYEAVNKVRKMRQESTRDSTRKLSDVPYLFGEIRQPDTDYLLIPRHSSQSRRYIPIGYMSKDVICGDSNMMIPNASLYTFGIMNSNVHMAWMRLVCGRIKSDYRYSKDVVYNNFPWPENPSMDAIKLIEFTAKQILDVREKYTGNTLADLYDPATMPQDLFEAIKMNNSAVMRAYGFSAKDMSEEDCVIALMRMYQKLTERKS